MKVKKSHYINNNNNAHKLGVLTTCHDVATSQREPNPHHNITSYQDYYLDL